LYANEIPDIMTNIIEWWPA